GDRHVLSFNIGKTLARPIFKGHEFEPLWSFEASYDWLQTLDKWTSRFFAGQGKHNHIAKPKNRTMGITVAAQDLTIEFNHREGREPEKYLIALPHTIGVNKPHSTSYFSKDLAPVLYRLARANVVGD